MRWMVLAASVLPFAGVAAAQTTLSGPARVIDGDTISIEGAEANVRLNFIDAPEIDQTCRNAKGSSYGCGYVAKETLKRLVPDGTVVTCEIDGVDGYERYIGACKEGETDINGSMVWSGWAVEYERYSDGRYGDIQDDARGAGRGLWQGEFTQPWVWREEDRQSRAAAEEAAAIAENSCLIKGNISRQGRIYHMPGQQYYDRVRIDESRGERWFCSEEEAKNAPGWRRSLR